MSVGDAGLLARVVEIVVQVMEIEGRELSASTRLREDLRADLFEYAEVLVTIEEEFGLRVEDEDAEGLLTVGDLVGFIGARR